MTTDKTISIQQLRDAIERLPEDEPKVREGIWYTTQKQHWLGWLKDYEGPGGYGRKNWNRDARFVYNHVVCPGMLLYLARAIPLAPEVIAAAEAAEQAGASLMQKAGAIRKVAPWEMVRAALFDSQRRRTVWDRLRGR